MTKVEALNRLTEEIRKHVRPLLPREDAEDANAVARAIDDLIVAHCQEAQTSGRFVRAEIDRLAGRPGHMGPTGTVPRGATGESDPYAAAREIVRRHVEATRAKEISDSYMTGYNDAARAAAMQIADRLDLAAAVRRANSPRCTDLITKAVNLEAAEALRHEADRIRSDMKTPAAPPRIDPFEIPPGAH